jgi:antitoxin (DNA-binding transcriptional repressor) of toxin-antitoxin stability system
MKTVSMKEAKNRLTELAREVEQGETVLVTRNGKPVFEMSAPKVRGGLNLAAMATLMRAKGITNPVPYISDDFDDELPEDFLIQPLPDPK